MEAHGLPICTIRQCSILLNRYTLEFNGGSSWTFHIPLFSVFYKGVCDGRVGIRVPVIRLDTWYLTVVRGLDNPPLIAALAFISSRTTAVQLSGYRP
jgi:hypothetical protein